MVLALSVGSCQESHKAGGFSNSLPFVFFVLFVVNPIVFTGYS
jgi:hypothetical protein